MYEGFQRCKIENWKERSRNRADWERSIKEAVVPSVKKKKRDGYIHTLAPFIRPTRLFFFLCFADRASQYNLIN